MEKVGTANLSNCRTLWWCDWNERASPGRADDANAGATSKRAEREYRNTIGSCGQRAANEKLVWFMEIKQG